MIGANLKRIRQKKKMTQQQLADFLMVSRQAVCLWEVEKREIKASILHKISNVLKVSMNDLVRASEQDQKDVQFELRDKDAKEVFVIGDFTEWKKRIPLRRSKGVWRRKLGLKPGRYEYKFIVDGQWRLDPQNNKHVYNDVGTLNSVKEL